MKTMKVLLLPVNRGGESDGISERGTIGRADFDNRSLTILRLCSLGPVRGKFPEQPNARDEEVLPSDRPIRCVFVPYHLSV